MAVPPSWSTAARGDLHLVLPSAPGATRRAPLGRLDVLVVIGNALTHGPVGAMVDRLSTVPPRRPDRTDEQVRRADHDQTPASQQAVLPAETVVVAVPEQQRAGAVRMTVGCEVCGARSDLASPAALRPWLRRHPYACSAG